MSLFNEKCTSEEKTSKPPKRINKEDYRDTNSITNILFGPTINNSQNISNQNDNLDKSFQAYIACDKLPIHENPLKWWKDNEKHFPVIAKIAKKYLSIPATSVPCERVFSDAGNIITKKRSSLKCEMAEKLIMLFHNRK